MSSPGVLGASGMKQCTLWTEAGCILEGGRGCSGAGGVQWGGVRSLPGIIRVGAAK
jgi:hypothetical protein